MSDRGLPIVDGAPACPFVAFEDDRDERAMAPDHRHRCFAETRAAPRALAHQEAYCLASTFSACPTFQDWARREAARPRAAEPPPVAPAPPSGLIATERPGMPPPERESTHAAYELPPRRNPPRDWAAPPPWLDARPDPDDDRADIVSSDWDRPDRAAADHEGRGLSGGAAERLLGRGRPDLGQDDDDPDDLSWEDLAERHPSADRQRTGATGRPHDDALEHARGAGGRIAAGHWGDPDADDAADHRRGITGDEDGAGHHPSGRPAGRGRPAPGGGRGRERARTDDGRGGRTRRPDASEVFGPAWERPRRFEAYPTLSTRIGLPGIGGVPRVAMGAIALVIAALLVFNLPGLLGVGGDETGNRPSGSVAPSNSVAPTATPRPTPTPAPTPTTYTIASGDTLSTIAQQFGLTLQELLEANPQITNPDRIRVGDVLVIPLPPPDEIDNGLEITPEPSASG